jgi:hypothetical protein
MITIGTVGRGIMRAYPRPRGSREDEEEEDVVEDNEE